MTLVHDTLVCDSTRLTRWQHDAAYDYNRDLETPEFDLINWLKMKFVELLREIFGSKFADDYGELILIVLLVALLLMLAWFVYKKNPQLFMKPGKRVKKLDYEVEEDTIYGIDFQLEIDLAISREDYKEAVRLCYLQTLKRLDDAELIDWQPHKTSTQYIYEVKDNERRDPLRQLTNRFLRVRYGNFEATSGIYYEMTDLQQYIMKGGRG